jgi:DNA helicase-2/ATP-dependent DNA helicase PcrA
MKNKMQLDIYQKKAVEASEDKILCLAAAGSGKTRALTERIRYLIENKHQDPMQIVAITFTNTAADEMKKRLEDVRQGTFIGTLHSYANFICLKNGIDTTKYIEMKEFDKIIEKAILISRNKYPQINHLLIDEA